MLLTNNQQAFLELVRAGLWADVGSMDLRNHDFLEHVDWEAIYQLAGEQSVVGLVTAGIVLGRFGNQIGILKKLNAVRWRIKKGVN